MKREVFILLLATILVFGVNCKKNPDDPNNDCLSKLDFIKITYANDVGQILSNDPSDWTNDPVWCQEEYDLFSTDSLDLTGSDTSTLFTLLFPNPVRTASMLILIRPKLCPFQCVIVNRSFQVLDTFSIPNWTGNIYRYLTFSDSLKYIHGEYYRLYYAAHCTSQLFFYKGHGDFLVE